MISRTLEFIMASLSPQVAPKSELELEILQKLPKAARLFLKVAQKWLINTAIFAIYHKTDAVMHT